MTDMLERLYEEFDKVPIVDTHSHLAMREEFYDRNQDFLRNLMEQYLLDDLICAGMTPEERKDNPPKVVFVDESNRITSVARYEKHGMLKA